MAIVKMSSFSLFAFDSERDDLLHELQKFGYVHFSDLANDEVLKGEGLRDVIVPEGITEVDQDIANIKYALEILSKNDSRETGLKAMIKGKTNFTLEGLEETAGAYDYKPVYESLKDRMGKVESLNQEEMRLNAASDELKPWVTLGYPVSSMKGFSQSEVFTGTVPKKLKDKLMNELLPFDYTYYEVISEGKDESYLLAISSKEEKDAVNEVLRNNSFSSIKISGEEEPDKEMHKIAERLSALKSERDAIKAEIKEMAVHLPDLEVYYEYLMNKKVRLHASENFLRTDSVNVIRGYIPTEMAGDFRKAVEASQKNAYYLDVKEATDEGDIPILLKNNKLNQTFESLTAMYALPQYNEIDPTPLLAPFYLFFFGMMVADVGYGLILLVGTAVILKIANLSESTEKFIRFFFYLSIPTIFWGAIYGSFFGGIIKIPGLIDPAKDYMMILIMSIIFGLVHVFFALGVKAFLYVRAGDPIGALFDAGFWYMALIGAIGFLLPMFLDLPPAVKTISMVVMIIGMGGIVVTGGRSANTVVGKAAGGLYSLYGISSYVGDFVSYSRLMALGLSGGFIASAINMMIGMLSGMGIIGILFGVVLFVGGQAFNIFLSLLGAYVHTSRLTYVEFFGKFYSGGGKPFNLFQNASKYINLK
ncbi:V-type ATP synthase subunit I [Youngiibacter multivorans]|uniref:V/A-type H+-transporting ATPase subunit I n=1 Tax=Youngiibacter multivorans TaxID=937251 RepID=A0ABS4G1N5_9CLOT|nr:V-type ATP synthase subunit I [Youngiibacter multivorans]MBP1918458.1 V/A-type H+-transporting ATPase subunit I [Youngiibacter multivorans]